MSEIEQKLAKIKRKPKSRTLLFVIIFMVCFAGGLVIGIVQTVQEKPVPVVTLSMVYGSEKEKWINDITQDFQIYAFLRTGVLVLCDFKPMGSRKTCLSVLTGEIQPDIISPPSSNWLLELVL